MARFVLQYGGKGMLLWLHTAQTQITQGRSPARCRLLVVHQEVHREDGVTLGSPGRVPPPSQGDVGVDPHSLLIASTLVRGCQPYVWETYLLKN